jgi:hypothetical protein
VSRFHKFYFLDCFGLTTYTPHKEKGYKKNKLFNFLGKKFVITKEEMLRIGCAKSKTSGIAT